MLLLDSGGALIDLRGRFIWLKGKKIHNSKQENGLGFCIIHDFNMKLLEQYWRLIEFTDSLLTKVLQGKYYRLSSPLRSGAIDSFSYVWRSL